MGAIDSASIFDEIQSIVHDKLQVVSYKWLSRNFSLSSNDAKRMLKEFVEVHGCQLEVIYVLSGWLKNKPQSYSVVLVSKGKLPEAQEEFKDGSVQVYSVQASIPKDPAVLVSAEYVQSEELFAQHLNGDNCLWDNRYGAISNSFVKRNDDTEPFHVASTETKRGVGISVSSASNNITKATEPKQCSPLGPQASIGLSKDTRKMDNENSLQGTKSHVDSEKTSVVSTIRKKEQNGQSSSVSGGSLANLWGRASSRPKDTAKNVAQPIMTSDAQICAHEENDAVSSGNDDDVEYGRRDLNGSGKRKRRVVFDFSDEDEDEAIVSLASPEPPKSRAAAVSEGITCDLTKDINGQAVDVQKVSPADKGVSMKDSAEGPSTSKSGSEIVQDVLSKGLNEGHNEKKPDNAAIAPTRRKVLKTRIDDRGREVTEVVWEGENEEGKNVDSAIVTKDKNVDSAIMTKDKNVDSAIMTKDKNVDSVTTTKDTKNENHSVKKSSENRSVTLANTGPSSVNAAPPAPGKLGNKKTKSSVKDVKQGSITSFFKKAT